MGFVRSDEFLGEPALHVGVSKNSGTLKSSFFIWVFHCVNHPFWGFSPYIWKRPFCCQVFCVADGMGFLRPKKKEPTTSHASKHMSTCISVYIYNIHQKDELVYDNILNHPWVRPDFTF